MGRPLDVMREYVTVLRGALTGKVRHQGPRYQVDWQSGMPSLPAPPPVLLGGLGPKMLELAGEIADGAVLWLCAPEYIRREALPAIRRGRERAGKPLAGFEIVAAVPAAITVDRGAALALFKRELTRYLALPFYRAMLEKSGFGAELAAYDRAPAPEAVPDRLAGALGAVGDYRDARRLRHRPPRGRRHPAGDPAHRLPRRPALPADAGSRRHHLRPSWGPGASRSGA